jgi:hypothetical protein
VEKLDRRQGGREQILFLLSIGKNPPIFSPLHRTPNVLHIPLVKGP